MSANPLISCVMVTHDTLYRRPFIERSLKSYAKQTYVPKELVVVLDDPSLAEELAMRALVSRFPEESIRCFSVRPKRSLGSLRNISLDLSLGELICQWDDDDFSHSHRLQCEARHLVEHGLDAVFLRSVFYFFEESKDLYWLDFHSTKLKCHPATVLFKKKIGVRYQESGDHAQLDEDTFVLNWLKDNATVGILDNPPQMYTYVYHGGNNTKLEHHQMLASRISEPRERILSERSSFLDGLGEVGSYIGNFMRVRDRSGTIFEWPN